MDAIQILTNQYFFYYMGKLWFLNLTVTFSLKSLPNSMDSVL